MDTQNHFINILMVEDNRADALLVKTTLQDSAIPHKLQVVINGSDAWEFLERVATNQELKPDLVILDLNLPGLTGREILDNLLERRVLLDLPICIFTGAAHEVHIINEYPQLNLCFEAKTADLEDLRVVLKRIIAFAGKPPRR